MVFDSDRQPLPGHRRQHQPVRVGRLRPDRRAGRPAGLRRAAHRRQHQRPARQGAADPPGGRRHLHHPEPATCSRRAPRRPGRRSTRWASATRSGSASTRRPTRLLRGRLRPGRRRRRARTAARRAPSSGTSITKPGNYGWPYCIGDNYAYNDYTFPTGAVRRGVQLRGAGQQLAQQHRPDQPAAGGPGHRRLRLRRQPAASRRSAAAARRWAARSTATTPDLVSDRKWPAYYDGKAIFGEWNQNKMYTFQVDRRTASRWSTSTSCSAAMNFLRPMDIEFGPDGALYLIEWGTGFGGNNDDSGDLPDRLHRRRPGPDRGGHRGPRRPGRRR